MFSSNSPTNKMKLKRVTILTINILLSIFMSTVNCTDTAYSKNKKSSLLLLENENEFVKMFAIGNMLHYFSRDSLKNIQHPLKDRLEAFFKGITGEFENEAMFIAESYEFFDYLEQLNHNYSPYNHSLVDLLTKIQETLARAIVPIDNIDSRKYNSHPFLCQSFPLKTFYSTKNDIQGFKLMLQNSLRRSTILHPKDSFSSYFDLFCSIRIDFPRYFYGYTDGYDDVHPGKIDLREDYVYTIYDDFNFYKFRLKAFINEINGRYYFFVQENGNWRAFLNNREIFSFDMDTTCPIIFVLEKISEVKKK